MMHERKYRLSEIADANGVDLARVRSMRARGHTAMWDTGIGETADDHGRGWRRYSLADAVALGCVLELMARGLSAEVADRIVSNCNGWLAGHHPDSPALADAWIGVVHLNGSAGHVGGHLAKVLAEIDRMVARDIRDTKNGGGGAAVFLINASNHARRLAEKLDAQ